MGDGGTDGGGDPIGGGVLPWVAALHMSGSRTGIKPGEGCRRSLVAAGRIVADSESRRWNSAAHLPVAGVDGVAKGHLANGGGSRRWRCRGAAS